MSKLRLYLIILCFFVPFALAGNISMVVEENGKVISYYDEYYVVQVTGNVSITNSYNNSMYNVVVPYNIGTLNIFETSDTGYISPGMFEFVMFNPFETKSFSYEVRGITATDPMLNNMSVLRSSVDWEKATLHSLLISRINKGEVEQNNINTSGVISVRNRRLVTVTLENPSGAEYNVSSVSVLKTPDQDPNDVIEEWHYPENSVSYMIIHGHEIWERDIIDYNVSPDDVYWLSVDMDTGFRLSLYGSRHNVYRFDQDDLLDPVNMSFDELEELGNASDYLEYMMYVKKTYSDTWMLAGNTYDVDIRVNNFAPVNRNITVTDFIPPGFEIVDDGGAESIINNTIIWKRNVNPDSSEQILYKLKYTDDDSLGMDFFEPCMVSYGKHTLYSQRIPFVRKSIPKKKIFLQKKIEASANGEYIVELYVKNVGEYKLENILVKEFLGSASFREISQMPIEKGLWKIPEIKVDEAWTVSYVTTEHDKLTALPEIIGVEDNTMLKTLLFENVISTSWYSGAIMTIEYIGIAVLILSVVLFVPINRWRRRVKERELRRLGKEVHKLRIDTTPSFGDTINYLRKESEEGIDLPDQEKFSFKHHGHSMPGETRAEAHHNLDELEKLKKDTVSDEKKP